MENFSVTMQLNENEKTLSVKVLGDIGTAENLPAIRNEIDEKLLFNELNKVSFNLVDALPSEDIFGFLLGRYKKARQCGIRITIEEVSEAMDRVLKVGGIYEIMPKEDNGEASN